MAFICNGQDQLIFMEQDQTETKHHKRLREMFRLFQRTKKQREKASQRSDEESKESKVTTPAAPPTVQSQQSRRLSSLGAKRQSKSPAQSRSPSKETRKSPSKKTSEAEESATTVDEDETVDETASARKRRLIRKKYGIQIKDEDFVQRECKEEIEEFENVAVALRPAATKMRKAKLRWKAVSPKKDIEEETLESPPDITGTGWEESMSVPSESDFTETTHDEDKNLSEKYAKRYAELKANPKENVEQLLKELHTLFLRVSELEQLEKTYQEQIQELRKQLAMKDEKISELSKKSVGTVAALPATMGKEVLVQKTAEKEDMVPAKIENETLTKKTVEKEKEAAAIAEKEKPTKTSAEGEKMSAKLEAVAKRGLDILRRNQLLEQTLNDNEARIIASFFESEEPKPDKKVVDLIDKALSYGVEVLLTRPDLFEDFVDNELRLFLIDADKAKRILLDCMLLHPQYVPTKWGGNIMKKRQREVQDKTAEKAEEKSKVKEEAVKKEDEKSKPTEASTVQAALQTTRNIFDYLVEASKWAASASTPSAPSASFSKEKSTTGEKTVEKTLPKSESSKSESKTESDKKNEKEIKAQPKPSESKSEEETRIKQQAAKKPVKEHKEQGTRNHGKGWKTHKSGSKSPAKTLWVQDRERHLRSQAKVKQRPKKKN
ncbi:unnamed protein product [Cylicocyclus nassatus]|uniref:DUF7774 domain-containing protein n=1 Tax=Cylicocyclus nassatus TaxID=53992 RepID=A0AA36M8U8_CYLNA|nr:unnamed protein product [Cylicocyclus nassatus]